MAIDKVRVTEVKQSTHFHENSREILIRETLI